MEPLDAFVPRADGAMIVVTAPDPSRPAGCLVGFHTQVSIEPLRYGVCLSHTNDTFDVARVADELGVHLLGASQIELASLFGEHTADDGFDKFDRCAWRPSRGGVPVLAPVLAWFVGRIVDRVALGDHTLHVLEPLEWGAGAQEAPLRFADVASFDPGH